MARAPTPLNYNANGATPVENGTQKFWVGGTAGNSFVGECALRGVVTFLLDHGTLSSVETPVDNQADCARGVYANN
jgi:hypothetical protein